MTWNCQHCSNAVDEELDACWACGAQHDGTINTDFEHADSFEPTLTREKAQFRLSTVLHTVTATCCLLAVFSPRMAGWTLDTEPTAVTLFLGISAGLYAIVVYSKLFLTMGVWLPAFVMYRWQDHYRRHHRSS